MVAFALAASVRLQGGAPGGFGPQTSQEWVLRPGRGAQRGVCLEGQQNV